uniref:Uncharacterized protein n=1 Tax=Anguilla anguilla TaxID=7936 RepID=A0A0E9RT69_ANGAN
MDFCLTGVWRTEVHRSPGLLLILLTLL